MPTDVITVATVATFLVRQDSPLFYALPFLLLTLLLVAIPLLVLLLPRPEGRRDLAEAARVDEHELLDRQRVRDPALPGAFALGPL